jgi:ABC-type branched-subunit amino acid transport system permease subunit
MGLLAGLVAGILGFVGLKPVFSIEVNKITGVLAAIALLLPGLGIFIAIVTSHNFFNSPLESSGDWPATPTGDVLGIIVEILVRLLLISYCWLVVLIVGIRETLTEAHLKPKQ